MKAKADLSLTEKRLHQLETHNNDLSASIHQLKSDLTRALNETKVTSVNNISKINSFTISFILR